MTLHSKPQHQKPLNKVLEKHAFEGLETELLKDLMSGERVHMSFDLPLKLRNAFKLATRRNKQTMCPVLQDFIMAYVAATHFQKACFNNTLNPVVKIENLVIPSYERLKFRRQKESEVGGDGACHYCGGEAVGVFEYVKTGRVYSLCSFHAGELDDGHVWRACAEKASFL